MVVFSHGLASSPVDGKSIDFLVRLASYGYVVAAPFHGDPRFSRVRLEDLSDYWYLLSNFDRFVEMQALRPLAIKATIDLMLSDPQFASRIDATRIGGVGGSMGGATMVWLLGAKITCSYFSLDSRNTVQDPRIKAAVGYVPYAGQHFLPAFGNDNATASAVSVPFLAISGTDDTTAPIALMEQALNNFRGTRFLVALSGVPHTYQTSYADDVFGWMLPFLDAHVNGNKAALDLLVRQKNVRGGLEDILRIDNTVPNSVGAGELRVDEFYNDLSRHYALFARQADKDFVERGAAGPGWRRTGYAFKGLSLPGPTELRPANQSPVCRYYIPAVNTHFYSALQAECDLVRSIGGLFDGVEFWVTRASDASCPAGTQALTRLYNNRWHEMDSNHRYLTSASETSVMQRQGWSNEGVVMCVPL